MAKNNHLGALAAAAGTLAAVGLLVLMLVLVVARPAEATFPSDASSTGREVDVQGVTTGITGKSLLTVKTAGLPSRATAPLAPARTTRSIPPQCSDGIDNDGDGYIDLNDPGCLSETDNDETG